MKKIVSRVTFGLVLLAIVYWLISNEISDKRSKVQKKKVETEKRLQTEASVADMAAKHNAVTNWEQSFDKKDLLGLFKSTYTVEVEDALVRTDHRPIMLFASVADVGRETNNYSVHFYNWFGAILSADIHFVLDCTPDQVKEIMLHRTGLFEKYAIIAQVSEVKKVKLRATVSAETDEVVLEPSNVFIAKGRCLDLLFVDDYKLSKDLLGAKPE